MAVMSVVLIAVILGGCAGGPPGETGEPGTSATPSGAAATARPTASPTPATLGRIRPSPRGRRSWSIESLLGILPAKVRGVAIQPSPDTAAGMIADPSLADTAAAIAVGLVAAPGASGADDLAISAVIRLRPGVYSDDFFARWRRAYDEAACAPAGGVVEPRVARSSGGIRSR